MTKGGTGMMKGTHLYKKERPRKIKFPGRHQGRYYYTISLNSPALSANFRTGKSKR